MIDEFPSTWQRHKAKKCFKECWYCKDAKNVVKSYRKWIKYIPPLDPPLQRGLWVNA